MLLGVFFWGGGVGVWHLKMPCYHIIEKARGVRGNKKNSRRTPLAEVFATGTLKVGYRPSFDSGRTSPDLKSHYKLSYVHVCCPGSVL